MVDAYNDRIKDQYLLLSEVMRFHAFRTEQHVKSITFEKYIKDSWPLITDSKPVVKESLKEKYERLNKRNKATESLNKKEG